MANNFRQLPAFMAVHGIEPQHVLHVGAHQGQEVPFYITAGFRCISLVEPNYHLLAEVRDKFSRFAGDLAMRNQAVGTDFGYGTLHIMSRDNLSTLADPTEVDKVVRNIQVRVVPLDYFITEFATNREPVNVLILDTQGTELDIIKASSLIDSMDLVICETSTVEDRTMAPPFDQVVAEMERRGFVIADQWERDYQWLVNWARGKKPSTVGLIIDVLFVRKEAGNGA